MNSYDLFQIISIILMLIMLMSIIAILSGDIRAKELELKEFQKEYLNHKKIGGIKLCKKNQKN